MGDESLTTARGGGVTLRYAFLKYPGESPEVDYKAAVKFDSKSSFSLKLVRHILGMSNAGGGAVVIGYKEDAKRVPKPDPDLTDSIVASYEISSLSSFVEKFVRGTDKIRLIIHKDEFEGKLYPIIEVASFGKHPYFCKSTKNGGGKPI